MSASPYQALAERWEKEAAGYLAQAGIKDGTKPDNTTPEQRGHAYTAGTYRTCAHELRKAIRAVDPPRYDLSAITSIPGIISAMVIDSPWVGEGPDICVVCTAEADLSRLPGKIIDGSTTADDGSYDVVIKLDGPIPTLAEELPEPPASTVLEGAAIASHRGSLAEAIKNGDKPLAAYYACLLALIAIDPSVEGSGGSISGDGYFIKIEEVAGAK